MWLHLLLCVFNRFERDC
uniref:Uncharacterized protein n=1 Tax=Anopheles dirus TaxID=7168 RepID=A0A182NYI5_9DIPT